MTTDASGLKLVTSLSRGTGDDEESLEAMLRGVDELTRDNDRAVGSVGPMAGADPALAIIAASDRLTPAMVAFV